uniref:C-X-C motif chemokine n=1 Tax=Gopherus evgoodei TaxID=1825980 RepID=A0A8C4W2H6_9SAUR
MGLPGIPRGLRVADPAGIKAAAGRCGAPMAGELRCQCLQTEAAVIHPKLVAHVELIPEGPHCGVPEVIATTKHGKKVCLDPTAPWVKLIVTKIMNSDLSSIPIGSRFCHSYSS